MNLTNITDLETYKPKEIIVNIFPPGWRENIEKFKKENWQDKNRLKVACRYDEGLWAYMKNNNIIPKDIAEEIEIQVEKDKTGLMEFWNEERS